MTKILYGHSYKLLGKKRRPLYQLINKSPFIRTNPDLKHLSTNEKLIISTPFLSNLDAIYRLRKILKRKKL